MSHEIRFERCRPDDFREALRENPLVYLPLGAMEWHGEHLPVGLDSMTAHGLCLRAAEQTGGLVYPPLYYGMTGTIWHHPWTILVEEDDILLNLLFLTLSRLADCGVEKCVIFTGHFAARQLAMLEKFEKQWEDCGPSSLNLKILSVSHLPDSPYKPDHGAIFETSLLWSLHPERVRLDCLPNVEEAPANDPDGDSYGPHRREPGNALFGILGDDPRPFDEEKAERLRSRFIKWLIEVVQNW